MAGVAAIFYSTLIASYSAIEVMRDETIQTAEASVGKKHIDLAATNVMTWQEYQPSSSLGQRSLEINSEPAQPSRTITRSTTSVPGSLTQKTLPHENTTSEDASDY